MDLATIIQQAAILNNTQTAQAQQMSDLMAGASKEASGIAKNLQTAGQLTAEAELTKLQGELNTQNARVKVANAYGTNVNAQSDIITQMAESMRQDAVNLVNQQNTVSEIEGNSDLLGNPLGWVRDLLYGDEARSQRDALAQNFETKSKLVTSLNAATQSSVATQNAISETLTQTSIKQLADSKRLLAESDAAKARIEAARYGVSSIEALQQVGAQNFSRDLSMYNAVKQEEQWNIARADALERRKAQTEIDEDVGDMVERINAYRQTFQLPSVNAAYVKRNWGSGKVGDMLREQEIGGWRIIDNGGSSEGALGSTPSDAYFATKTGDVKTPPSWKPSMDILEQTELSFTKKLEELDPTTGKTRGATIDQSSAKKLFDETVKETAAEYQDRIDHGKGNPYQAPPIEAVLESPTREAKALGESEFGRLVLKTMLETGVNDPTPELLMATGLAALENGQLSMSQVRDGVTTYYREAVGLINATGGFATMNVPASTTYRVPASFLKTGGAVRDFSWWEAPWALQETVVKTLANPPSKEMKALKKVQEIDLTNSADVTTALTVMQSRKMADKIINAKGTGSQ